MEARGNASKKERRILTEVEEVDSLTMSKEMIDLKTVRIMVVRMGIMVRETIMEILEVEDKVEEILEVI